LQVIPSLECLKMAGQRHAGVGTYLLIEASLGVRRRAKIHKPFDFGNRRVIPPYFVAKIMAPVGSWFARTLDFDPCR